MSLLGMNNFDPFDRMLISQAKTQNIYILSHDINFKKYDKASSIAMVCILLLLMHLARL